MSDPAHLTSTPCAPGRPLPAPPAGSEPFLPPRVLQRAVTALAVVMERRGLDPKLPQPRAGLQRVEKARTAPPREVSH